MPVRPGGCTIGPGGIVPGGGCRRRLCPVCGAHRSMIGLVWSLFWEAERGGGRPFEPTPFSWGGLASSRLLPFRSWWSVYGLIFVSFGPPRTLYRTGFVRSSGRMPVWRPARRMHAKRSKTCIVESHACKALQQRCIAERIHAKLAETRREHLAFFPRGDVTRIPM